MAKRKPTTKADAARIQSAYARAGDGQVPKDTFPTRMQRAAARNEHIAEEAAVSTQETVNHGGKSLTSAVIGFLSFSDLLLIAMARRQHSTSTAGKKSLMHLLLGPKAFRARLQSGCTSFQSACVQCHMFWARFTQHEAKESIFVRFRHIAACNFSFVAL